MQCRLPSVWSVYLNIKTVEIPEGWGLFCVPKMEIPKRREELG